MNSPPANQIRNVSHIKLHLQNIIGNIKVLEELESAAVTATSEDLMQTDVVQVITRQTADLLQQLEEQIKNEESLLRRIKLRKNKRKTKNIKNRNKPKIAKPTKELDATTNYPKSSALPVCATLPAVATKPHHQLRNQHAAQCQLRSLELLKMLHAARGQNDVEARRFASQLSGLRTVWNSILQENTPQSTRALKIEQQWSETYFGSNVQTYYGVELKIGEFLNRRHTWDSYLTRSSKRGSVIPTGWVLPNAEVDARWLKYVSK